MAYCSKCGTQLPQDARFCRGCGAPLQVNAAQAPPSPPPVSPRYYAPGPYPQEWLRFEDVVNNRDRLIGGIGSIIVLIAAFIPWYHMRMFWGMMSQGGSTPSALICAAAGIVAAIFLFRKKSGTIVMVMGIIIAALALLTALGSMSNYVSPYWGVLFAIVGGGMLGYSGYSTKTHEGG